MRMAARPCHSVGPHQQVPSSCMPAITRPVVSGEPKDTSTWFKMHLIQNLVAGPGKAVGKPLGAAAIAVDQLSQSGAAQRLQGGPDIHAAGAPRKFGDKIQRFTAGALRQVGGRQAHRAARWPASRTKARPLS